MIFYAQPLKYPQALTAGLWLVLLCLVSTSRYLSTCRAEMLLLQSGAVLEGDITESTEEWIVTNPTRQLKVRKTDTLARGTSAQDLYRWQRKQLAGKAANLEFHLRLADWCLGQELWVEASRELLDAKQLNADSPQLRSLQRRLIQMSESANSRPELAKPTESGTVSNQVKIDWQAVEKSWRIDKEHAAQFARKIQPLLVNNCTTSGCHRAGSNNEYQLDISLRRGHSSTDSTRRNLLATLTTINQNKISESMLLEAARGPHAKWPGLTGRNRDAWIATLEDWVQSVTEVNKTPKEAITELATEPSDLSKGNLSQAASDKPSAVSNNQPMTTRQPFTPRDEFDPEIFNRLFRDGAGQ